MTEKTHREEAADLNPFVIDDNDLWWEWGRQPSLTRKAGRHKAEVRHELNIAKSALKVCAARIKLDIRRNPARYGLIGRITEDMIETTLEINRDYLDAQEAVRKLDYALDIAEADVMALVDKRKALENRVQLLAINYHSEKEPRHLSKQAYETFQERQTRDVRVSSPNTEE